MNMDTSNAAPNGSPAGSTMGGSSTRVPNGGNVKSGGLPLLRLPVVVVLNSNLKKYNFIFNYTATFNLPFVYNRL